MKNRNVIPAVTTLYVSALYLRFAAGHVFGDRWWWLGLANTLALYLFLPLPIVALIAIVSRRRSSFLATAAGLILFLALYGRLFVPRGAPATGRRIRVLTFNTPFPVYGGDEQTLVNSLLSQKADIVFMQELTTQGVEVLQRRMVPHYPFILAETSGLPYEGKLILSKYPLRPDRVIDRVTPRRTTQVAVAVIDKREVMLANMHPTATAGVGLLQDLPAYVQRTFSRREQEIDDTLNYLDAAGRPVIIAGDMNVPDQTAASRRLTERYQDCWREAGWGFGHTFPAPVFKLAQLPVPLPGWLTQSGGLLDGPMPQRLVRIDYVLHSPQFRARNAWTANLGQSDHIAVGAELVWDE
jgi:endonuclease/exonuclease/phosphatase (EEP) superfamily protein YafD